MNQNDEPKPTSVAETPKQAGEARAPWWWVERTVWTEPMLTRLTSGESTNRVWFRLWDKTYAPANLQRAFHKVWQNGGSAGADKQTLGHLSPPAREENSPVGQQMSDGTHRPQTGRRGLLPQARPNHQRALGGPAGCPRPPP